MFLCGPQGDGEITVNAAQRDTLLLAAVTDQIMWMLGGVVGFDD